MFQKLHPLKPKHIRFYQNILVQPKHFVKKTNVVAAITNYVGCGKKNYSLPIFIGVYTNMFLNSALYNGVSEDVFVAL